MLERAKKPSEVVVWAGRGQTVTFAADGDHANPTASFKLRLQPTVDASERLRIENIVWSRNAAARKRWLAEQILGLEHYHYIGTQVATLNFLFDRGCLKAKQ